jgi:hypothetical protein
MIFKKISKKRRKRKMQHYKFFPDHIKVILFYKVKIFILIGQKAEKIYVEI